MVIIITIGTITIIIIIIIWGKKKKSTWHKAEKIKVMQPHANIT